MSLGPGHYTWDWSYPNGIAPEWNAIREQFRLDAKASENKINRALLQILEQPGTLPEIRRLYETIYGDNDLRIRLLSCWLKLEVCQRRGFPFDPRVPPVNHKGKLELDHDEPPCVHLAAKDRIIMRAIRSSTGLVSRPEQVGVWLWFTEEWLTGDLKRAINGLARREGRPPPIDPKRYLEVRDKLRNPSNKPKIVLPELTEQHHRAYEAYLRAGDDLTPEKETKLAEVFGLSRDELIAGVRAIIVKNASKKSNKKTKNQE